MHFDLRLRDVLDDLVDEFAGVEQRALAVWTDTRRDLVRLHRTLVERRFGPRRARMFSLADLPPILRRLRPRGCIGLWSKALLPPHQLQLQLRHLRLQLGILGAELGVLGAERDILGSQFCDLFQQRLHLSPKLFHEAAKSARFQRLWQEGLTVTRSDRGAKVFANMKTVIRTCQKQGLNFFDYARQVMRSTLTGLPPPLPLATADA